MHTLLIVEDVRSLLDLQLSFLKRADVAVSTAKDGIEAIKKVKQERPDLVILGMEMPRMNGLECCRFIKSDPILKRTPVIILAGSMSSRSDALKAGSDQCLQLPISEVQLLREIHAFLPIQVREQPRTAISIEVRYTKGERSVVAYTQDLSTTGCSLITRETLPIRSTVVLTLHLPTHRPGEQLEEENRLSPYEVTSVVKRTEQEAIGEYTVKGMGLQFLPLNPKVHQVIEQLVKSGLAKPTDQGRSG